MLMSIRFTFLIPCLHFLSLQAQDTSTLNGQLIDSTTQIPVPFAHVRLRESVSMSNQHGNFTLNYIETDLNVEVKISCIGYKTFTVTIEFLRKFPKVMLIPDIKVLDEVVISELSPQTIFSVKGKSKVPSFYVMGFFLVNVRNFGISHALIKVSTFDASGKLYAKLHVAGSYIEIRTENL